MKLRDIALLCSILQLFFPVTGAQILPYNPTTILLSEATSETKDIAYIFLPTAPNTQHYLASLNISSTISAANLSLQTITTDLPFLSDDSIAFIPSLSTTGEISVYAGSCSTSSSSSLWRFTPSNISISGNGTWSKESTSTASRVTSTDLPGADFLSSGFSFSTLVPANASQTNIYIFGGMCPTGASSTVSTWQSAASYSNHMLRLAPATTSLSNTAYILDLPTSRGPPIAEAGFTITGLAPTYSNGSGVLTQAQSFVLLGGHTQTAFINMSQIAIWSLPEESWSFVTVDPPSQSANTELAVKRISDRAVANIDSRSGHTAVLTEDGASIVVYGGWVGDITQAADPQLAILKLGTGFGGSGDWIWSIPAKQPSGSGIYGHGAVMLPGNVMMVLGGYNISSTSSKRAESLGNTTPLFLNATSMSWISNYTNPTYIAAVSKVASLDSSARASAKKVGLGAGLGLGFAAVITAVAIYFWYSRHLKRKREAEREKDDRGLNLGAADSYSYNPNRDMGARGGGVFGRWDSNDRDYQLDDSTSAIAGYENLNVGVHGFGDNGSIPMPPNKQIPRKPLNSRTARGLYQPTPTFETGVSHSRANSLGTAGPIHPIYEADEDLEHTSPHAGVDVAVGDPSNPADTNTKKTYRYSDPFKDPPTVNFLGPVRQGNRSTSTPSPESPAQEREREISEWVSDWAAADALLHHQAKSHSTAGRLSPTKRAQLIAATNAGYNSEDDSGRTASNLSDRSLAISAITLSRSGSSSRGRSRSNSLRGFLTNAMHPFTSTAGGSTILSETFDRAVPLGPRAYPPGSAGSGSGATSFNTAQTSFSELQAQAENLLPRPDEYANSREDSPTSTYYYLEPSGSPSKSKGPSRAQGGWLGSLRRVFVGESQSGNGNDNPSPDVPSFSSGERSPARLDPRLGAAGVEPRRTMSAGATLWRRKQGKGDWEDSAEPSNPQLSSGTPRSATFTGDSGPPPFHLPPVGSGSANVDDEEWDIEKAIERRVVQVMFTVPKERLRVVNHDVIDDLSDVGSLRSKQGSQKEKEEESRDKGKGKEIERPKSKVLDMVEQFETRSRHGSPER